ncbi:MAG: SURF1 family protein [Giesbergeria sp.]
MRKRRAAFWLVTFVGIVGMVLTAGLGVWQLARAAQKGDMAAEMASRNSGAPLGAAQLVQQLAALPHGETPDHMLYRPVLLRGHWLPDYTVYLDNRPMDGHQGFFVLTPLQLAAEKSVVLVQRGWIPRNFLDRNVLAEVATPPGEVEVSGHLAPEPTPMFSLGSGQSEPGFLRIRQNLRLAEFRVETGLPLAGLAVVQDGTASQGLLRNWAPISLGVEKNYGYAFQWFALCGLILGLYVWFQFVRPRRT